MTIRANTHLYLLTHVLHEASVRNRALKLKYVFAFIEYTPTHNVRDSFFYIENILNGFLPIQRLFL